MEYALHNPSRAGSREFDGGRGVLHTRLSEETAYALTLNFEASTVAFFSVNAHQAPSFLSAFHAARGKLRGEGDWGLT